MRLGAAPSCIILHPLIQLRLSPLGFYGRKSTPVPAVGLKTAKHGMVGRIRSPQGVSSSFRAGAPPAAVMRASAYVPEHPCEEGGEHDPQEGSPGPSRREQSQHCLNCCGRGTLKVSNFTRNEEFEDLQRVSEETSEFFFFLMNPVSSYSQVISWTAVPLWRARYAFFRISVLKNLWSQWIPFHQPQTRAGFTENIKLRMTPWDNFLTAEPQQCSDPRFRYTHTKKNYWRRSWKKPWGIICPFSSQGRVSPAIGFVPSQKFLCWAIQILLANKAVDLLYLQLSGVFRGLAKTSLGLVQTVASHSAPPANTTV